MGSAEVDRTLRVAVGEDDVLLLRGRLCDPDTEHRRVQAVLTHLHADDRRR